MSAPTNNCGITSIKYSIFFSSFKIKILLANAKRTYYTWFHLCLFFLAEKPHTVVAVQMKTKSPLIRRSKDVNHVVPPFYRLLTEKPALSGHLATTAAVTGSPDFPTIRFRKSTPRCVSRLTAASFHQPETL